jgi:hypothetical protein
LAVQVSRPESLPVVCLQAIASQQDPPLKIGNIVGTFIIRLIGAVLLEANDEWQLQHRYMQTEPMTELTPPLIEAIPTQISTAVA